MRDIVLGTVDKDGFHRQEPITYHDVEWFNTFLEGRLGVRLRAERHSVGTSVYQDGPIPNILGRVIVTKSGHRTWLTECGVGWPDNPARKSKRHITTDVLDVVPHLMPEWEYGDIVLRV